MKKDIDRVANVCMHPESRGQKSPQETANNWRGKTGWGKGHLPTCQNPALQPRQPLLTPTDA